MNDSTSTYSCFLALLAFFLLAEPTSGQNIAKRSAFVDVIVVPMDRERVLEGQTVLVENGRIARIAPQEDFEIPDGTEVIAGKGRFLMPGLCDLHVHIVDARELVTYLGHGVTTVRNLMGMPWHLQLREEQRSGRLVGPRIYTSGPFTNLPHIKSPEDARQAVADQKAAGYDCIKIHDSLESETYEALLEAAVELEIPVVGHAPRNLPMEELLAHGIQADISHVEEYLYTYFDRTDIGMDEDTMREIADQTSEAGIAVVANLIAYKLIGDQIADFDAAVTAPEQVHAAPINRLAWGRPYNKYLAFRPESLPGMVSRFEALSRFTKVLNDAGVTILLGSDAGNPVEVPGFSAHQELALLVAAGLSPYEALRAATSDAGEFLEGEGGPGTISVGQVADMVLVAGNPLSDIANARNIEGVMFEGEWRTGAELREAMADVVSRYDQEMEFVGRFTMRSAEASIAFYDERKAADGEAFVFGQQGIISCVVGFTILGNMPVAMQLAELGTREHPNSWRILARLAELQMLSGDESAAMESLAQASIASPNNEIVLRQIAAMRRK